MKILQINTVYKEKSTGRTCMETEKALLNAGHDCVTAYGCGAKYDGNAYRIDSKIEYYVHNVLSKITGLEGYFSIFATWRLIRFINTYQPDVVHLRNLHGHYLNLPILFRYLSKEKIPVVQNLHDHWAFTGKCPYYTTINCNKWVDGCDHCPELRRYPQSLLFDRTSKLRKDKEKWYSSLPNLTVVGVSKWTRDEAKKSFFGKCASKITHIYNWINTEIFKPYPENREETRKKYGIPENNFVIICVSAAWTSGTPRYEDLVKLIGMLKPHETLLVVGKCNDEIAAPNVIFIPYVSSTDALAHIYSCADVYIHLSIEDTFGKVIAEALSCGTPTIVYDVSGCAEIPGERCGFVITPRNVNEIRHRIDEIKEIDEIALRTESRNRVMENFSYEKNTKQLIDLYTEVSRQHEY